MYITFLKLLQQQTHFKAFIWLQKRLDFKGLVQGLLVPGIGSFYSHRREASTSGWD